MGEHLSYWSAFCLGRFNLIQGESRMAQFKKVVRMSLMLQVVDEVFDDLLGNLGCVDGTDALLIAHWQDEPRSFRIQVTRKSDGSSLTKLVTADGAIRV